jgi:hypothetical protein
MLKLDSAYLKKLHACDPATMEHFLVACARMVQDKLKKQRPWMRPFDDRDTVHDVLLDLLMMIHDGRLPKTPEKAERMVHNICKRHVRPWRRFPIMTFSGLPECLSVTIQS